MPADPGRVVLQSLETSAMAAAREKVEMAKDEG
jgi:hypothetical protein